ncbi:hypothetical protein Trydic_g8676 [Trypoxylus dichotomus]
MESARRSRHSEEIPIPTFNNLPILLEDDSGASSDEMEFQKSESDSDFEGLSASPQRRNQQELNDVLRDLSLSNESSRLLPD